MTRIRRLAAWLNALVKPNKRWMALASLTLGGVTGATRARQFDRIERRLSALERGGRR